MKRAFKLFIDPNAPRELSPSPTEKSRPLSPTVSRFDEGMLNPEAKKSKYSLALLTKKNKSKSKRTLKNTQKWVARHTASAPMVFTPKMQIYENSKKGEIFKLHVIVYRDGPSIYKTFHIEPTQQADVQRALTDIVMREVQFQLRAYKIVLKYPHEINDDQKQPHRVTIPKLESVWFGPLVAQLKMEYIEFDPLVRPTKKMYEELENFYSPYFFHNDFNAGNFKYDQEGNLVLLDFGSGNFFKSDRKGGTRRLRR